MMATPEVVKIILSEEKAIPACQDSLVKVVANGKTLYAAWHAFARIRREFQTKFRRPMPAVIVNFQGKVRAEFLRNELRDDDEARWIDNRLGLTSPPKLISPPAN